MIELTNERLQQILHEETAKKEELSTLLRSIYIRYMRLYEKYFADIDALNDGVIAELRKYNEETRSLFRYYYMDIPMDVCRGIEEFEHTYNDNLLGPEWRAYLFDQYESFKEKNKRELKSEECLRTAFAKQVLEYFYATMDYVFRDGFGTGSNAANAVVGGISDLLFGKKE